MAFKEELGQLFVAITADLSNLDKGLQKAAKDTKSFADNVGKSTRNAGLAITAVGTAITATFGLVLKQAQNFSDEIFITSQRTGIAVETLSKLKFVAEQTEATFQDVATGLKFLNRNIFEADRGNTQLLSSFTKVGVSVRDVNGKLISAEAAFLQIADRFKSITSQSEKTALAMQLFGRSGANLIPVLNLGSDGINRLSKEAERLGLVLTTENAKAIDQFSDNLSAMKASLGGLALVIGTTLIPQLTRLVNFLTNAIVQFRKFLGENKALADFVLNTALAFGILLVVVGPIVVILGQIIISFAALVGAVSGAVTALRSLILLLPVLQASLVRFLFNPITLIVGALAILTAAWFTNWGGIREFTRKIATDLGSLFEEINRKMLKSVLVLQNLGEIPLKERILHPIESLKKASENADRAVQALVDTGDGFVNLKDNMGGAIDALAEKTDNFKAKLAELKEGLTTIPETTSITLPDQVDTGEPPEDKIQRIIDKVRELHAERDPIAEFAQSVVSLGNSMEASFSTALSSIITGATSGKEAIKQLGASLVQAIADFVAQRLVAATIGRAIQIAEIALAKLTGKALAQAYQPAATLANIATFGAAGVAGTAGVLTALATTKAAALAGFAKGTDNIPAMLSSGEMVVPQTFADAIRKGDLTLGGDKEGRTQNAQPIVFENIEINVAGNFDENNSDLIIRQIGEEIESRLRGIT